jgi:hypothetical protein
MNQNLKEVFLALKGSSQVTVDLKIDVTPKCIQSSRRTGQSLSEVFNNRNIYKYCRYYGTCGLHYEKTINNRLEREGNDNTFQVEHRKWGTRIANSILIEHKNQVYLEMMYENKNSPTSKYYYKFDDDTPLSQDQSDRLESEFLPINHGSKKQQETGIQKEVIVNNIKLQNIVRFAGYGITIGKPITEMESI